MTTARASENGNGRSAARRALVTTEIYAQAARLFAVRGYAGTSLQDVADATGMSRQALYHYVRSKDALLAQLVTDITRSSATQLRRINGRTDLDATGKLTAVAKAIATHRASQPHSFLLVVRSEAEFPDKLSREHRRGKRAVLDELVKVLDEGVRSGDFRPVDVHIAALSIMGMLNWVAEWFNPNGRDSVETIAETVASLAVSIVIQHPSRRPDLTDPSSAIALIRDDLDVLEQAVKRTTTPSRRVGR